MIWLLLGVMVSPTVAQDNSSWQAPVNGQFNHASNWTNGIPGSTDIAHFGFNSPYSVSFHRAERSRLALVNGSGVDWDLNGRLYVLSGDAFGDGLIVDSTSAANFAFLSITDGQLNGRVTSFGNMVFGDQFNAEAVIGDSTTLGGPSGIAQAGIIGRQAGSTGLVSVIGTWTDLSTLTVGDAGFGFLDISGQVDSENAVIGSQFGGLGQVVVHGAGSRWTNTRNLQGTSRIEVGKNGIGTLTITDQGTVQSDEMRIGFGASGHGTVNVSQVGSTLDIALFLIVGDGINGAGQGTLNVTDGGKVTAPRVQFGFSGGNGTGLVSGIGSTIETPSLSVGVLGGSGELTIADGGLVKNSDSANIGFIAPSGKVTVKDVGSKWDVDAVQTLAVGSGQGSAAELRIENGGQVFSNRTRVGQANSNGIVTVTGNGSLWDNNLDIIIADDGIGELNVYAGGKVDTYSAQIGFNDGQGTARISGAGSRIETTENFSTGVFGAFGRVDVTGGGRIVTGGDGVVGLLGNGFVRIKDANSHWDINDELLVGGAGIGIINVQDGGTLDSGSARIGASKGQAEVLVEGAGSTWNNAGTMDIGSVDSYGIVKVRDDGRVETDSAEVNSALEIYGSGSRFRSTGAVEVGVTSKGAVRLFDRGLIDATEINVRSRGILTGGGDVIGDLNNLGGQVIVGSQFPPDLLEVNGSFTQDGRGRSVFDLRGTIPGLTHDQLQVDNGATINGSIVLNDSHSSGQFGVGDSFNIVRANSVVSNVSIGGGNAGRADVSYEADVVSLFNGGQALRITAVAPVTFNGPGTEYNDPNNWSTGQVPGRNDHVILKGTDGSQTLELNLPDGVAESRRLVLHKNIHLHTDSESVADTTLGITIEDRATLSGFGQLRGEIFSHGRIDPADFLDPNPPERNGGSGEIMTGTLAVDGNYFGFDGSAVALQLASHEAFDLLDITGVAVLDENSILDIDLLETNSGNLFMPEPGSRFDVLFADAIYLNGVNFEFPDLSEGSFRATTVAHSSGRMALQLYVIPEPPSSVVIFCTVIGYVFLSRRRVR